MEKKIIENLIGCALSARDKAYCPYSKFAVGAALLTKSGEIFVGCNIENAAYSSSNCAERTAFFNAVSGGVNKFSAICIAGGKAGKLPSDFITPCGVCRQVMLEFCEKEFVIITAKSKSDYKIFTLDELLPHGFSL